MRNWVVVCGIIMTKILSIRRPENDMFIDLYVIFKISLGTFTHSDSRTKSPSIGTHLIALFYEFISTVVHPRNYAPNWIWKQKKGMTSKTCRHSIRVISIFRNKSPKNGNRASGTQTSICKKMRARDDSSQKKCYRRRKDHRTKYDLDKLINIQTRLKNYLRKKTRNWMSIKCCNSIV